MSHNKVAWKCHGTRGFRLNSRRFSVQRLRKRFLYLFRLFTRWRFSYGHGLKSVKKCIARSSGKKDSSSRRRLVMKDQQVPADYSFRSFARSNSFYSEAITDCLEFIKRNSLSLDDKPWPAAKDREYFCKEP